MTPSAFGLGARAVSDLTEAAHHVLPKLGHPGKWLKSFELLAAVHQFSSFVNDETRLRSAGNSLSAHGYALPGARVWGLASRDGAIRSFNRAGGGAAPIGAGAAAAPNAQAA